MPNRGPVGVAGQGTTTIHERSSDDFSGHGRRAPVPAVAGAIGATSAAQAQAGVKGAEVIDGAGQVHAQGHRRYLPRQTSAAPHQAIEPCPKGGIEPFDVGGVGPRLEFEAGSCVSRGDGFKRHL